MGQPNVTTVREALMAELLQDADRLIARLETVDGELAQRIDTAVRDAAGQAFLASKLNFESMIGAQARTLADAGRTAGEAIEIRLNSGISQIVTANASLERKATTALSLLACGALLCGAMGGFMGALLVHWWR